MAAAVLKQFASLGLRCRNEDKAAIFVLESIRSMLENGYATEQLKITLPLSVAAIGGRSIRFVALKARAERTVQPDRRSELRKGMERAIRDHPGESLKEILNRLEPDYVKSNDGVHVCYWMNAKKQKTHTITYQRVANIFTDALRSITTEINSGVKRRYIKAV
jgi:hypothetical protein